MTRHWHELLGWVLLIASLAVGLGMTILLTP